MKKVLIFYAAYGGGHLSAARSIKEYIDSTYPDTETMLVDCIEYVNKTINKMTTFAYKEMAKKFPWAWGRVYYKSQRGLLGTISSTTNRLFAIKLNNLLQEFKPDLVISTHPFGSQMCGILKKHGAIQCKIATVMTDYAPHDQWLVNAQYGDYFFVAHAGMKTALMDKGIPESKIFATGIPLSNRFLMHYNKKEILTSFDLVPNKRTVLFFGGGELGLGKEKTLEILKTFTSNFENIQIVAISGKNEKMKRGFEEIARDAGQNIPIHILEYTNKVPELMSIADLVVTKPGGLTTSESLASGLPIVVINPLPGQEEENAEFLENKNVAIWIRKEDNAKEIIGDLFHSPDKMQSMKINARLLAKKNSTKDICEIVMGK